MSKDKINMIEDPLQKEENSITDKNPFQNTLNSNTSAENVVSKSFRKFEKKSFFTLVGIFTAIFIMKQYLDVKFFFISECLISLCYASYYVLSEGIVKKFLIEFIIGFVVLFLIGIIPYIGQIALAIIFVFVLIKRFRLMVNLLIIVLISLLMIFFLYGEKDLIVSALPITTGDLLYFALASYLSYAFTIRFPLKTAIFNVSLIGISMGLFAALISYYLHSIYDDFKAEIINPEEVGDKDRNGNEPTRHMHDFTRPFSR